MTDDAEVGRIFGLGHLIHLTGMAAEATRRTRMTTTDIDLTPRQEPQTEGLVERLFLGAIEALEVASVHLGSKLGFYQALAEGGPATSADLAARAGTDERYTREWLEQQATAGLVTVDDPAADPQQRRFALPDAYRAPLTDPDDVNFVAPIASLAVGALRPIDTLIEAYRTGAGVPYEDYGQDVVADIGAANRPQFLNLLSSWLAAAPGVDARLKADPPARVADVACGTAWSSIAIARAYPKVTVDALDVDTSSIEVARANILAQGLGERITATVQDASAPSLPGRYDLITIFEALHDMNHPVEALRTARQSLVDGGRVLIADERVAEQFTVPGDEIERLNYGFSILHCLAVANLEEDSAATGTVIRPSVVRRYATEAGFRDVEVLPIDHEFWRFYLLTP